LEGTVTLDGKPLADATVSLGPMRATAPGPFSGTTDSSGHFVLGAADDPGGGAVPGEYYVNITTVDPGPGDESTPPPTQKEVVPMAYRNSSTKVTVPPEGDADVKFDLKSR
jgi:hypothetical protein